MRPRYAICAMLILLISPALRAAEVRHYWNFDSITIFEDQVGTAHGSVTPMTTVTTDLGYDGNSSVRTIDLVDDDDFVRIDANNLTQPLQGDFSMSYWFNMEDDMFEDPRGIFDFSGDGGDGVQSLFIDAGGNANNLAFRVDGTTGSALALTPIDLEDGDWHFVAATYAAGGSLNVHVDGLGIDASASTVGVGTVVMDPDSYLGSFNFSVDNGEEYKGLNGLLDNVAYYDGVLTDQEIADLYSGALEPTDIGDSGPDLDFNNDGALDCADIDPLTLAIATASNDLSFDLTGDGVVNIADRDIWLAGAGAVNLLTGQPYLIGDATLDGVVDVSDFNSWNANKFTTIAAWCSGDFNADGVVDVSDFNDWNANKFTSADAMLVPEPASGLLGRFSLLGLIAVRRRRFANRRLENGA